LKSQMNYAGLTFFVWMVALTLYLLR